MERNYKFGDNLVKELVIDARISMEKNAVVRIVHSLNTASSEVREPRLNSFLLGASVEGVLSGDVVLKAGEEKLALKSCVLDITNTKRIVQTAINGFDGTVKEWVSNGDTLITLVVDVFGEDDNFPVDRTKEIMEFLKKNRSLVVDEKYLNGVEKITRVVVIGKKVSPKHWDRHQQIIIDLVSDSTYEIEEYIIN